MVFAHFGALSDKPQPVEIHVGTAANGNKRFAFAFFAFDIAFDAGQRQATRGLHDRSRVLENILDRCAHFVGIDQYDFIHQRLGQAKGLFAHLFNRHTVGEQVHVRQFHTASRL